jgi:hypothetical protein
MKNVYEVGHNGNGERRKEDYEGTEGHRKICKDRIEGCKCKSWAIEKDGRTRKTKIGRKDGRKTEKENIEINERGEEKINFLFPSHIPLLAFQKNPHINLPYKGIILHCTVKQSSNPYKTDFSRGIGEYLTLIRIKKFICCLIKVSLYMVYLQYEGMISRNRRQGYERVLLL